MEFFVIVAAIIVVGTGIFYGGKSSGTPNSEVLNSSAEQVEISNTPTQVPEATSTQAPTITASHSPTIIVKPTSIPTNPPTINQNSDESFVYPGSRSMGGNSYTSSDDPDKITNWYKEKINSQGYSSKSFVTTKTNEKVLNKLSAAKNNKNILIEISRANQNSESVITILLDK